MRSQIKSHFFYVKAYLLVLSTVCLLCSSLYGAPTQPTSAQSTAAPSVDAAAPNVDAAPEVEGDFEEETEEGMSATEGAPEGAEGERAEEAAAEEESNDAGEPLFEWARWLVKLARDGLSRREPSAVALLDPLDMALAKGSVPADALTVAWRREGLTGFLQASRIA